MHYPVRAYFNFLLASKNQHGIHSPFVFHLTTQCFYNHETYPVYQDIKRIHKDVYRNFPDFKQKTVSFKKSKLLYRLIQYFEPNSILAYNSPKNLTDIFMALEHHSQVSSVGSTAKKRTILSNLKSEYAIQNLNISEQGIEKLPQDNQDFIFMDGEKEDLYNKFDSLLPFTSSHSLVIIDGIHLSSKAELAWKKIKKMNEVRLTIDLFYWGMVFFKKDQAKQHFKIRI